MHSTHGQRDTAYSTGLVSMVETEEHFGATHALVQPGNTRIKANLKRPRSGKNEITSARPRGSPLVDMGLQGSPCEHLWLGVCEHSRENRAQC